MKKYTKYILTICLTYFTIYGAWAHDKGRIKGAVTDAETNLPLQGAHITLEGTDRHTITNDFGKFQLTNVDTGQYQLRISYVGFQPVMQSVTVTLNKNIEVGILIERSSLELSEIAVTALPSDDINTISAIDINLRPVQTSQDILRSVPGLFIAQHAGGGKAEQIFLRGFDIDHGTDINLSVDGMPVNMVSHAHGQGYSDLHFIIPETVGRVNFQKGPYYADKGNFTTAGFVDFSTVNALERSMIKLEGGQFDTYRTLAMIDLLGKKARTNNQHAYVASEFLSTQGYFDSPQNFTRLNLMGKYHGVLDENKYLTVLLSTFRSKWDASGQIPERAVESGMIERFGSIDDTEGGFTDRTNLSVKLGSALENGGFLNNQVYVVNYGFELYSNFTFFLEDPVNGDQIRQKERRNIYGYTGTYSKSYTLFGREASTDAEIGLRYDDVDDNELSHTKNRRITLEPISLGDVDEINAHAFIDQHVKLANKITLNAGLRLDHFQFAYVNALDSVFGRNTTTKALVSPKLNIYYQANAGTQLFLKSGIGFHSNDSRVILANTVEDILPKAFGAEVGGNFKPFPSLFINTSLWLLNLEQEFVYVGDAGIVEPSGKTRRAGVDLSARYQPLPWLFADVDMNITHPRALEVSEGENYIPLAPVFSSTGGLSFKGKTGINGSLRYRHLANRPANEDNSVVAEGYWLLDAVLRYTQPKFEVGLSAENILNAAWNEAQFDTESRLPFETEPMSEIHFTPGTPFFVKASVSYFF